MVDDLDWATRIAILVRDIHAVAADEPDTKHNRFHVPHTRGRSANGDDLLLISARERVGLHAYRVRPTHPISPIGLSVSSPVRGQLREPIQAVHVTETEDATTVSEGPGMRSSD